MSQGRTRTLDSGILAVWPESKTREQADTTQRGHL